MVILWVGAAAITCVCRVVSDCKKVKLSREKKSRDVPHNDPPQEEKVPEYDPAMADNIDKYAKERAVFEKSLKPSLYSAAIIELDILEAFVIHAKEGGDLCVLQSLILLLTVANCAKGLNSLFPTEMLPFMAKEGLDILNAEIEKAAPSFEFMKVALRAATEICDIIMEHISESTARKTV